MSELQDRPSRCENCGRRGVVARRGHPGSLWRFRRRDLCGDCLRSALPENDLQPAALSADGSVR